METTSFSTTSNFTQSAVSARGFAKSQSVGPVDPETLVGNGSATQSSGTEVEALALGDNDANPSSLDQVPGQKNGSSQVARRESNEPSSSGQGQDGMFCLPSTISSSYILTV